MTRAQQGRTRYSAFPCTSPFLFSVRVRDILLRPRSRLAPPLQPSTQSRRSQAEAPANCCEPTPDIHVVKHAGSVALLRLPAVHHSLRVAWQRKVRASGSIVRRWTHCSLLTEELLACAATLTTGIGSAASTEVTIVLAV
jgi:hypothetical protein